MPNSTCKSILSGALSVSRRKITKNNLHMQKIIWEKLGKMDGKKILIQKDLHIWKNLRTFAAAKVFNATNVAATG
jgi:hypothetical protein